MPRVGSQAKVLFITPYHQGVSKFMESTMGVWGRRLSSQFPLGVALLAALTPREDFSVALVNEYWHEGVDYQDEAEIVALSFMTCNAPRAYEIADQFRSRGKLVVMGGMHVSACADEAAQHADVIFVGEGEETWPQFLQDFRAGRVQPVYRAPRPVPAELIPLPDRVIAKRNRKLSKISVIASRGCPYGCDFCSVTTFFGRQTRCRPVAQVMAEIREAMALEQDRVRFLAIKDDNIAINKEYAHELLENLIPLKVRWVGQSDLRSLNDPHLIRVMRQSGCMLLASGIESANACNVSRLKKTFDETDKIREVISLLHKNNIFFWGSYIVGFDDDTPESIDRIYQQAIYLGIDFLSIAVMTPFPGSVLYDQMLTENRIVEKRWEYFDIEHLVFEPKKISASLLNKHHVGALKRFYAGSEICKRMGQASLRILQSGRYVPLRYSLFFNLIAKTFLTKCY